MLYSEKKKKERKKKKTSICVVVVVAGVVPSKAGWSLHTLLTGTDAQRRTAPASLDNTVVHNSIWSEESTFFPFWRLNPGLLLQVQYGIHAVSRTKEQESS